MTSSQSSVPEGTSPATPVPEAVFDNLAAAVGADHVITDADTRRRQSQDVYRSGELPMAVVRPGSTAETAAVVAER